MRDRIREINITRYQTDDGAEWSSREHAEKHDETLTLVDVMDSIARRSGGEYYSGSSQSWDFESTTEMVEFLAEHFKMERRK